MTFTANRNPLTGETTYTLTITENERRTAKLYTWDYALLHDIETSTDVTIADQLLGLEMIARRIEESDPDWHTQPEPEMSEA